MADQELFGNRRKALEDEYFYRQEQELIETLRRRGLEEAARRRMADQSGVADEAVLRDLQSLGYTPDTVNLLHLVPLLQMAWAEGSVSDAESRLILEAAQSRGIDADSTAGRQLRSWLADRPSDDFFEKTLRVITAILQSHPSDVRDASEHDILARLTAIASASGGILGFGAVSPQEQQVLARVAWEMEQARRSPPPAAPPAEPRP